MRWEYASKEELSTGYEDLTEEFKKYTPEKYRGLSNDDDRSKLLDEVVCLYRRKNLFPIIYYTDLGIKKEIERCINKKVSLENNVLDLRSYQGGALLRYLFPNFFEAYSGEGSRINAYDKFFDDAMLKEIIAFVIKFSVPLPGSILSAMNLYRTGAPTNFNPMRAKALYEKYCPENGVIYDFAAGYGGRMLGALTSKNNYKYIGVDPNTKTYNNLLRLGQYIEGVTGRKDSYEIYCTGSETFEYHQKEFVDFAFSSPPYFNLEKYSDEPTQCYIKYDNLFDWFRYYVEPTIQTIYDLLKNDAYYAVNIADFEVSREKVHFVDRWLEISEKIGFDYVNQIYLKIQNRGGNKRTGKTGGSNKKEECIYVFKKVGRDKINNYEKRKMPLYVKNKVNDYFFNISEARRLREEILQWFSDFGNVDHERLKKLIDGIDDNSNLIETISILNNYLNS
jgi:hypothetical protein